MRFGDWLKRPFSGRRPATENIEELIPALQRRAEGRLSAPWDDIGFALKLLQQLKRRAPQQNVFISPAGLAVSLLLLHNGARGGTRAEIEGFLGLKESRREELNRAVRTLITEINAVSDIDLILANSIWVREEADLLPDFQGDARACFEADVERADFHSAKTLKRMKEWIVKKTRGKCSASAGGIDPRSWISILNSVYFKGNWLDPFNPKETRSETFTRTDGTQTQVPMMFHKGYFRFVQGENFLGVSLPYRGNRFRMVVFLPQHGCLHEFVKELNPALWNSRKEYFRGAIHFAPVATFGRGVLAHRPGERTERGRPGRLVEEVGRRAGRVPGISGD